MEKYLRRTGVTIIDLSQRSTEPDSGFGHFKRYPAVASVKKHASIRPPQKAIGEATENPFADLRMTVCAGHDQIRAVLRQPINGILSSEKSNARAEAAAPSRQASPRRHLARCNAFTRLVRCSQPTQLGVAWRLNFPTAPQPSQPWFRVGGSCRSWL